MLDPWNNSSLLPPPVNMFICTKKVDISGLRHACNNINKVLSKQSPLHQEGALCTRFLYKYDRKFRNDIGYRNFRKVHTALKKYLVLNLLKDIESFLSALPSETDDEKYLPTRQMLEYVMLRIITFSKIMLRICVCSKQAAIFYLNRIKRGESHWMSLLPYALLSRLWSMTMVLIQHSVNWYSNLYPYLHTLELKGLTFLPDNYTLPKDLEEWLDLKNVDNFGRFDWDQKKFIEVENVLIEDDEGDLFENILSFVKQSNRNESDDEIEEEFKPILEDCREQLNVTAMAKIDHGEALSRETYKMNQDEMLSKKISKVDQGEVLCREKFNKDQGETLSRESFKILLNAQNKTKGNRQVDSHAQRIKSIKTVKHKEDISEKKHNTDTHSHELVTNTTSLKAFIHTEERFRLESDNRSLTNHLSFMQWQALKNALLKLCDAVTNRKIDRKFQKIWKDKCLVYK